MNELISVVIPTYNRKDKLPACIESVLAQTYTNLRSSSWTTPRLTARSSYSTATSTRACTMCATSRTAARAMPATSARSTHAAVSSPFRTATISGTADKLQKQYDLLMATGADLCYCGMNRVAASGSSFYYPVHAPRPGRALEDFLAENRAGTQTLLMHRAVWEAVRLTRASAAIRTGTLPSARPRASGSCICRRRWSSPKSAATASPPSSSPTPTCCTCMKSTRRSTAASRTVTP